MARAHKLFIPGPSLSDAQIFRSKSGLANHPNFIFIIRIANYAYEFHYFDINKIITNAKKRHYVALAQNQTNKKADLPSFYQLRPTPHKFTFITFEFYHNPIFL